jgi:hypothetical protein
MSKLGRRTPPNFEHVSRYPLMSLITDPTSSLYIPPYPRERSLGLPWWWKQHDQGQEGACVGFGCSAMSSITNRMQRYANTGQWMTYRYANRWLYLEAQLVDPWGDTPPEEGTSVEAAAKTLRNQGHRRVQSGKIGPVMPEHGISAYRWAQNHDEIRAALWANLAVAIGVNWYNAFFAPYQKDDELWIDIPPGNQVAGGHCVCLYRMSDRRQAFRFMNSWGASYPPVWIGYDTMDRLINEYGEAVVITDR